MGTDISVTNVHLPKEFADNMQEATVWHNRNEFKTLQQEYDLRKIEVREAEAKEKQKLKEDLEKFTAEKDRDVADVRKKHKLVFYGLLSIFIAPRECPCAAASQGARVGD